LCNHVLRHVTLPLPCHVPSGVVLPCAAAHFHVSHCPWVLCCHVLGHVVSCHHVLGCVALPLLCHVLLRCCTAVHHCVLRALTCYATACFHVLCYPQVLCCHTLGCVVPPCTGVCDVAITVPCPPQVLYCCALQHVAVPSRCHITITCQAPVILPYIVLYPGRVLLASPRVGMGGEAETTKVTYLLVWK